MYFFEKQKEKFEQKLDFVPDDGQPATRGVNKARKNTHGRLLKRVEVRAGKKKKWEKSLS